MRLMASCNQVAQACWSSGAVFCPFLALGGRGSFAHQASGLHAEWGSDLDVIELVGVLDSCFGDSHVHSRAVFGVNGRVVHEDFDVCTKASSSRNVCDFVSQRVVPRREGVSARACRRVFAFLVKGGTALGTVTLLVFAPITVVGRVLERGVVHDRGVGGWELEESKGTWSAGAVEGDPVSAVGADVVTQVSGSFVDAGECEGGCCGTESCQVVGVFTSFSPDGLELGQGRP